MYNNTVLAILEKAKLITHEAAETLSKELVDKIHPARYDDALRLVENSSEKVKDFAVKDWESDVARLERRIAVLEKKLSTNSATPVAQLKVG